MKQAIDRTFEISILETLFDVLELGPDFSGMTTSESLMNINKVRENLSMKPMALDTPADKAILTNPEPSGATLAHWQSREPVSVCGTHIPTRR